MIRQMIRTTKSWTPGRSLLFRICPQSASGSREARAKAEGEARLSITARNGLPARCWKETLDRDLDDDMTIEGFFTVGSRKRLKQQLMRVTRPDNKLTGIHPRRSGLSEDHGGAMVWGRNTESDGKRNCAALRLVLNCVLY